MTDLATRPETTDATTDPLRLLTSRTRQLVRAVLLGALASGAGVALIGTAAWLLSRAAEQPPVMYLMVAIVGVRAFGIRTGVLRYAELVGDANVLILDEPTEHLDAPTATALVDDLWATAEAGRAAVLVITHDPALAARCDRVVALPTRLGRS